MIIAALIALAAPAKASTVAQSCELRAAMTSGGSIKPTDIAKKLFSWNKSMSPATIGGALAILDTTSYTGADIFSLVAVEGYFETHLIVGARKGDSPIYTIMRYERVSDALRLVNVRFKDKLTELLPNIPPGTQLKAISCG